MSYFAKKCNLNSLCKKFFDTKLDSFMNWAEKDRDQKSQKAFKNVISSHKASCGKGKKAAMCKKKI